MKHKNIANKLLNVDSLLDFCDHKIYRNSVDILWSLNGHVIQSLPQGWTPWTPCDAKLFCRRGMGCVQCSILVKWASFHSKLRVETRNSDQGREIQVNNGIGRCGWNWSFWFQVMFVSSLKLMTRWSRETLQNWGRKYCRHQRVGDCQWIWPCLILYSLLWLQWLLKSSCLKNDCTTIEVKLFSFFWSTRLSWKDEARELAEQERSGSN